MKMIYPVCILVFILQKLTYLAYLKLRKTLIHIHLWILALHSICPSFRQHYECLETYTSLVNQTIDVKNWGGFDWLIITKEVSHTIDLICLQVKMRHFWNPRRNVSHIWQGAQVYYLKWWISVKCSIPGSLISEQSSRWVCRTSLCQTKPGIDEKKGTTHLTFP